MPVPLAVWLPPANTALIVISGAFLLLGYALIRTGHVAWHRRAMLVAATFAALFLVVYVARLFLIPTRIFAGEGVVRLLYLALLASHVAVATLVAPFAAVTLKRGLAGRYEQHRRVARITLPMWLYAAASGWLVYVVLHTVS